MKNRQALTFGLAFLLSTHLSVFGTSRYWNPAASADFYTATNWVPVGVPASGDTLFITNATVNITPAFNCSGQITLNNGTLTGTGLNLAGGAVLTINGLDPKYLALLITNAGTINLASPLQFSGSGRTLVNALGGLIDVQGDLSIFGDGNGGQQIVNAGTFRKSAGPNAGAVTGIGFQNSGTVLAQSGTIDLQSGGTLTGACSANSGAAVTFSGGTFAVAASAVFSGTGFVGVNSGSPAFTGALATTMSWTGGTVFGQLNIAPNGLLAASGTGTRYLQMVVTNSGTITVASPVQFTGSTLLLANQAGGLVDVQGDVNFFSDGNGGQQIINAGTFRKSAGPNACAVNGIAFRNFGTVGLLAGQLYLNSPFTNSSGGLVVRLNSPSDWGQLVCSSTVVLGNPLQVSFASGYAPPVGGQFRILSGASLTGVFSPVNVQSNLAFVAYSTNSAWLTITNTFPQLSSPVVNGGSFSFYVNTVSGQNYTVERTDDLKTGSWVFYTSFTGNGSLTQVSIPVSGTPQRFFRVHQP